MTAAALQPVRNILEFSRIGFVNILAFRLRYYTGVVTYLINVTVYYFIWKALYANDPDFARGFSFGEMVTYVAVGWVIRSVADSDHGVRGGRLTLTARLPPTTGRLAANGELKIRDFTMWGAPTIARIVSLASFSGLANALSGRGIPVSRIVAPFALRNNVVTLDTARLVAADIGARADGTIDLDRQQFDLRGTVAPAYTINRLLGRAPSPVAASR